VLAVLNLSNALIGNAIDPITSGFPRFYGNTVPFLIYHLNATGAQSIWGQMAIAQG
jgi:hypothetical protein